MLTERLLGSRNDTTAPEDEIGNESSVRDNPVQAGCFYIVSMAFVAAQNIFAKLLFQSHSEMTPYQLLAYRGLISTIFNFAMVNRQAPYVLWDSIPAGSGLQLLIRVAQQNISIFITFYSLKQFNLTAVGIVNNSTLIFIMLFGFIFLKERSSLAFLTMLAISFVGSILIIFGEQSGKAAEDGTSRHAHDFLLLLLNPVIIAIGVIAMRNMKKLHEAVVTTYMNLTLAVIMLTVVYASGSDLSPWCRFSWLDWGYLLMLAISNVANQVFRFLAIQRSEVSKLQPYCFTQVIFQFVCDLAIFDQHFTKMQLIGVAIVFAVFLLTVVSGVADNSKTQTTEQLQQTKETSTVSVASVEDFYALSCEALPRTFDTSFLALSNDDGDDDDSFCSRSREDNTSVIRDHYTVAKKKRDDDQGVAVS